MIYRRQRNTIRNLLHQRTRATQRRRCHVRASIAVDYKTRDDVHADVPALKHEQRFRIVVRILELRNEAEERYVAGVGEDDVRHTAEGGGERDGGADLHDRVGSFDTNGDHGY